MTTENQNKQQSNGAAKDEAGGYPIIWRAVNATEQENGLPPLEKPFYLEYYSVMNGGWRRGEFVFQKLNVNQVRMMGVRRAQLNGGQNVDAITDMFSIWMAQFEFSLKRAPDWWDPEKEMDDQLLKFIFRKVVSFEDSFRAAMEKQLPRNTAAREEERPQGDAQPPAQVVDQEVPATANVG